MISKQELEQAAEIVRANLTSAMPKMISYKSFIQREVLKVATRQELEDVRDCKINQEMIDKLVTIAKHEWLLSGDTISLYCAAMAVATIVKEYDWGIQYLTGDGLYEMAKRIYNA